MFWQLRELMYAKLLAHSIDVNYYYHGEHVNHRAELPFSSQPASLLSPGSLITKHGLWWNDSSAQNLDGIKFQVPSWGLGSPSWRSFPPLMKELPSPREGASLPSSNSMCSAPQDQPLWTGFWSPTPITGAGSGAGSQQNYQARVRDFHGLFCALTWCPPLWTRSPGLQSKLLESGKKPLLTVMSPVVLCKQFCP